MTLLGNYSNNNNKHAKFFLNGQHNIHEEKDNNISSTLPQSHLLQNRRLTAADLGLPSKGRLQLIASLNQPHKFPALYDKLKMNASRRQSLCALTNNRTRSVDDQSPISQSSPLVSRFNRHLNSSDKNSLIISPLSTVDQDLNKEQDSTFTEIDKIHIEQPDKIIAISNNSNTNEAAYQEFPIYQENNIAGDDVEFEQWDDEEIRRYFAEGFNGSSKEIICKILSLVYGLLFSLFGITLSVSFAVKNFNSIGLLEEGFFVYLYLLSILWISFCLWDIRRWKIKLRVVKEFTRERSMSINTFDGNIAGGYYHDDKFGSGGLYMRIGIAVFSFGSLLHNVMILIKQVETSSQCINPLAICEKLLFIIFNFIQLFFMFKNSNIIIHNYRAAAYFGVMHVTITNICSWFHAIVTEASMEISEYSTETDGHSKIFTQLKSDTSSSTITNLTNSSILCGYKNYDAELITKTEHTFAPYLFPCTVEYTLMSFTLCFIIWQNLGRKLSSTSNNEHQNSAEDVTNENNITSNNNKIIKNSHRHHGDDEDEHVFYVNCQKSIRGLFTGIIILGKEYIFLLTMRNYLAYQELLEYFYYRVARK
ncbi:unnamed protein product [Didymodactylos carnosus]|uniref:Uncharacterized protein n=1 Tax=Didymodactylos carnosus TaxID=1234261 RepID=A0A814HWJ0_9BILA|nr:unnamed protein product [Didymodactylos carnosus]CAF3787140.1 unnamed protein product [Didymodactylos carnosus]